MKLDLKEKIIPIEKLPEWREGVRKTGKRVVVTNGCFDLLHPGHVIYLQAARNEGDLLLVGINADATVRQLKGEGRPVNQEEDRAVVLAGLESVSAVTIFPQLTATEFLKIVQPEIYVKGGDYTIDTIVQEERRYVESIGGRVVILAHLPGKSTTNLVKRIMSL
ncbi:MAG: D-glycero-beta-D-manno-heptose 1-phosphate adenylyltransferase [Verrucomicrobiota bacterium]|nr:D-glycero-beta-D-manno-heptose 1-phosphate adenylyltransferase [Verrucomicrobiota bacterium]